MCTHTNHKGRNSVRDPGSVDVMRHVFVRLLGISPRRYREIGAFDQRVMRVSISLWSFRSDAGYWTRSGRSPAYRRLSC